MLQEFKEFAMKGNVIDLAVAVVIGGAFGKITTSLVNDIIMPPLGLLIGGIDFSQMALTIKAATDTAEAVTINYGAFINVAVQFVVIAFAIFIVVKAINAMKRKEEEAPAEPAKPSEEVVLLTEIRDSLKR